MSWDPAPWAIEDAASSADVARLLAWHATNGVYGVAHPTDLRVVAYDVPGAGVRVLSGAVTVPNRALGKTRQAYLGINRDADDVPVPATGSSGARSDLIVARVENPITGEPWQGPPVGQELTWPYIRSWRYPDVPNTITDVLQVDPSASAWPLARVDNTLANNGTILQSMIVDLRGQPLIEQGKPPLTTTPMAAANQDLWMAKAFDRASVVEDVLPYTQTSYKLWPAAGRMTGVVVPADATELVADFTISCEQRPTSGQNTALGHCWGYERVRLVGAGVDISVDVEFDLDYKGGGTPSTVTVHVGGTVPIPAAARGRNITVQLEGRQFSDANTRGRLVIAKGSYIRGHLHWNVRPSSS